MIAIGFLAITTTPTPTLANDFTPTFLPEVTISRTAGDIHVDGDLTDPGWKGAARIDKFHENEPGDQIEPPVKTVARLAYDDSRLYVAVVCYDNPADIRASLCDRDWIFEDDNVGFFLDTYGTAQWAYTLNVNPYGIQGDALWSRGHGEDDRFDLIFESSGKITDSGYQVEIAIPFSSLRFPNKPVQEWRMEIWRHHQREFHHQISWAAYDRDEDCWPCQWGFLMGIRDVKPGKGIEFIPSVLAYQAGSLLGEGVPDDPYDFVNDDPEAEVSLNARYAITSDITVEATVNPDFSQVEADAAQVDVNETFALSYSERRPFFQEGLDLFQSWSELVYTRSINDPSFAAKSTARIGEWSFAYLGARDEHSPIILPFEELSAVVSGGKSFSNIFRVRRSFGSDSHLGILATDRRYDDGGSGSVVSFDTQLRLSKCFRLQALAVGSYTQEPDDTAGTSGLNDWLFDGEHTAGFDGEDFGGYSWVANLEERARHLDFDISYWYRSPTYRSDNGFEPQQQLAAH